MAEDVADEIKTRIVDIGLKYSFVAASLETLAFFSVVLQGGAIIIKLNINHPAYTHLIEILDQEVENVEQKALAQRLESARDGLKLLLAAWARYEDEQPDGVRRSRAQETRVDWGKIARQFLEKED